MNVVERAEVGVILRRERLARGLSRFRLAVQAGVSPQSVALAECGGCGEAMLARLAKALKVKLPTVGTASPQVAR